MSTTEDIINAWEFNVEDVYLKGPKVNKNGGKQISVMYTPTKKALVLKLPEMFTWGANDYKQNKKYKLGIQFPSEDYTTPEIQQTFQNLKALEVKIKQMLLEGSTLYFGKARSADSIDEAFGTGYFKYPKIEGTEEFDFTKIPAINAKLSPKTKDSKQKDDDDDEPDGAAAVEPTSFNLELFDHNYNLIYPDPYGEDVSPLTILTKQKKVATICHFGTIWVVNKSIFPTIKLLQGLMAKPYETLIGKGKCHFARPPEATTSKRDNNKKRASTYVDDDEDQEPENNHVEDESNGLENENEEDTNPEDLEENTNESSLSSSTTATESNSLPSSTVLSSPSSSSAAIRSNFGKQSSMTNQNSIM